MLDGKEVIGLNSMNGGGFKGVDINYWDEFLVFFFVFFGVVFEVLVIKLG